MSSLRVLQAENRAQPTFQAGRAGKEAGVGMRPVPQACQGRRQSASTPKKPQRAHLEGHNLLPGEHIGAVVAAEVAVRRGVDVAAAAGGRRGKGQDVGACGKTVLSSCHSAVLSLLPSRGVVWRCKHQRSRLVSRASPVAAALQVQGLADHAGAEVKGGLDCSRRRGIQGGGGNQWGHAGGMQAVQPPAEPFNMGLLSPCHAKLGSHAKQQTHAASPCNPPLARMSVSGMVPVP